MRPVNLQAIPSNDLLCEWSIPLDSNRVYCVYLHYTSEGDLFYIGKGKFNRPFQKNGRNAYWTNIVAKHGLVISILESSLNEEEAFLLEAQLIEKYKPKANLGTVFLGGSGLQQQSKEANRKRKISCEKYWTFEKKQQRSLAYKKENNPFFNKKHSEKTKQKLKQIRYSPIECIDLINNKTTIVSGTRAANTLTKVNRRQINLILKNVKYSYKSWTFKRSK